MHNLVKEGEEGILPERWEEEGTLRVRRGQ